MKLSKLLILLIFFGHTAVAQEPSVIAEYMDKSDGVITNVIVTLVFYKDYEALMAAFPDEEPLEGMSYCIREVENNMAWCTIHVLEPHIVDGENTLTAGHELFHGVYGVNFHKW